MSEMEAASQVAKRKWPERTHLRVAENTCLCEVSGDRRKVDNWGEYLTDERAEVGCPRCLDWMHA